MQRLAAGILGLLLILTAVSCGPEEDLAPRTPRRFPFLASLQGRISALRGENGTWLRDYLAGGGTLSEEINERRMSDILGGMLHEDPPEDLARFVRHAERYLYQEFFYAFSETERLALADTLREQFDDGSILGEKYAAVLGARGGKFPSSLERVIRALPLATLAEPTPLTRDRILSIAHESDDPAVMAGASVVLADNAWVAGDDGGRDTRISMATANNLMGEALKRVPDSPVMRMAYVLQCFNVDIPRARLQAVCRRGAEAEPENGAYVYLEALTLIEVEDQHAIAKITEGMARPIVTFHDVARAEMTAAFLQAAGLGTVGARLASYGAANVNPHGALEMRRLGQALRNLSVGMDSSASPAILFPRRLAQQLAKRPRLLATEQIRLQLHKGSWGWSIGENPDDPAAVAVRKELEALKAGRIMASGPEAWDEFFSRLGEEGFRKYLDEVLFGHEAEFLMRCATEDSIEDCAKLLEGSRKNK